MDSRTKERLKEGLRDYVESITQKSGSNKYVCPLPGCNSGKGKNHTGAFSIDPKDPTRWKCFSCGRGGDIFDLIGEIENITAYPEKVKRAGEILGIDTGGSEGQGGRMQQKPQQKKEEKPEKATDYSEYINQCAQRIGETDYHRRRGISDETARRYKLGYDPAYNYHGIKKALIIPASRYRYIAAKIEGVEDAPKYDNTPGAKALFNLQAITNATSPIFIVEGTLDALSIIDVGGEAVPIEGSTLKPLIQYMKENPPAQPLIIALDNDAAGGKGTEEGTPLLQAAGITHFVMDPYNGMKDANEALLADRAAFAEMVARTAKRAEQMAEQEKEEALEEYRNHDSAAAHLQEFIDGIAESANTPAQPTGFERLDKVLDGGLYEGLYIMGAITSLGKTTLALQIADQIAQSGRDVLIFSLEMARAELMSKSISRETVMEVLETSGDMRNAKTNRGITAGARYAGYSLAERELINKAIANYSEYAKHIYIHEGIGNIGVDQIRHTVEKHIRLTGQPPVVLVDYVQILAPHDVRATDKQNTDKAVLELKRVSRDYKIPVIGISSFNRASYKEEVGLEAFKESGSLEYGSDVLIGLQLAGVGKDGFNATEAKRKDPREIELVILKNRNGRTGEKVTFDYYALFNYFEEVEERGTTKRTRY